MKKFSLKTSCWRTKIYPKYLVGLLLCMAISLQVNAQESISIQGNVKDELGETIIGASVTVIGKSDVGVITDVDGNFKLNTAPNAKLKISYIGYVDQTVEVKRRTSISIVLKENTQALEEVVVIGYGTVKKKDLTGAVTSFKSEDITLAPTNDVMEALQGKIAGMDIIKSTGQLGENLGITLRGTRSIYGSSQPLFIIDGIPGDYNQINPSDIQTMDVLKDASSTAIYGSAGANGVIVITTKKGEAGKTRVNFDAYVGFSGKPEFFHGMMGDEWTDYQREAYRYKNGQYPADMSAILTDAGKLDAYNKGKWIDWVDEALGNTAVDQKYNLSVSSGTEKTKVFSSLTYQHNEGLLSNENSDRYAMKLNLDQEINKWAKVGFLSNIAYRKGNNGVKNTFTKGLGAFPLGDVYDEDGEYKHEYAKNEYTPMGDFISNQYANSKRYTYVNASAFVELTPFKGFSYRSLISGTLGNGKNGQYLSDKVTANRPNHAGTPYAAVENTNSYSYLWDNIVNYNKDFGQDHSAGITLVSSWEHKESDRVLSESSNQLLDVWSFYRLLAGTKSRSESSFQRNQKMSYAVRGNYSYRGKYLLTASSRWDGVSQFSPDHKWSVFPAGAFAWRISEEDFMNSSKHWLDNLKLRVGYGVTGLSGGVDAYGSTTKATLVPSEALTINGGLASVTQYDGTYASPNLGWEKSYNLNIGLDVAILGSRIDASLEWFRTKTEGLLFKRTIPVTSGVTGWGRPLYRWENLAETSNTGVELSINSRNITTKDFSWNTSLTFTWSQDKIESLPSGDLKDESLFEGQSVNALYGYKYAGIWAADTPEEVLKQYGVKPGWVKIHTIPKIDENGVSDNGVHKYGKDDRQILGNTSPDYIIGLNNNLTYRDFDLNVFVMARYGQTIESKMIGWYDAGFNPSVNKFSGADYWTENNQGAYFPVPGSGPEQSEYMSALRFRDGSFIKVKNITLGYTIPKQISRVAKMERVRFYGTAYNPFLYVKDKQLKGTDPELGSLDAFPLFKQFVFGVNITF